MKKLFLALMFGTFTLLLCSLSYPQNMINPEIDITPQSIKFQVEVSEKTANRIHDIVEEFEESFIDYRPAINKINILINEYNKAMKVIPGGIAGEGEYLNELMRRFLSQTEKYFIYYKRGGKADFETLAKIYNLSRKITLEINRLIYKY